MIAGEDQRSSSGDVLDSLHSHFEKQTENRPKHCLHDPISHTGSVRDGSDAVSGPWHMSRGVHRTDTEFTMLDALPGCKERLVERAVVWTMMVLIPTVSPWNVD